MAARKSTTSKTTKKSAGASTSRGSGSGFTAEERAAMRERAKELKAAERGENGEADVLAKLASMPAADRALGQRVHAIIRSTAPELTPRLWYGMPAYAKDGKVVCFFQDAAKFKARYATLGFSDQAKLDDGNMWPVSFGLTKLTPDVEARIADLVKRAVR